jgi:hypothetical protein
MSETVVVEPELEKIELQPVEDVLPKTFDEFVKKQEGFLIQQKKDHEKEINDLGLPREKAEKLLEESYLLHPTKWHEALDEGVITVVPPIANLLIPAGNKVPDADVVTLALKTNNSEIRAIFNGVLKEFTQHYSQGSNLAGSRSPRPPISNTNLWELWGTKLKSDQVVDQVFNKMKESKKPVE